MRIAAKGKSKKGTPYIIRYPESKDAKGLLKYINALSKERTYVTLQGQQMTLKKECEFITEQRKILKDKIGFALLLIVNGEIAGCTNVRAKSRTQKHVANLGLSIASSVRGQGLGEILMRTLLKETAKNLPQVSLMTLCVMEPNKVAQSLYRKLGFKSFGTLPKGITHRGKYVGEMFMYKPLKRHG